MTDKVSLNAFISKIPTNMIGMLQSVTSAQQPSMNTSSSFFSTGVRGLRPYTKYRVNVVALVRDRITGVISTKSSAAVEVTTPEDVPNAVRWLYARNRGFTSLRIRWGSISNEEANGILLGYTVYYRPYNSNESFTNISVNINVNAITITGLKKAAKYEIRVTGRTSVGEGVERCTYAVTECGQNFDKTSGEFIINGGSQFYYYRTCNWMIRSPVVNSSILLLFEEYQPNEAWTYIRSARERKWLDSYQKVPLAVLVLDSFVRVSIYKRNNNNLVKARYFIMNNSRSDVVYERGWNVTISNVSSRAIGVSWPPLSTTSLNSTYIYGYVVFLRMLSNGMGDILVQEEANSTSLSKVVSGLRSYVKYQVKAVAFLKDRVSGKISLKTSESAETQTAEG
ncbi:Phosphatidylinositol phosphatase PTPRQ, partial [Stylophora pistillata]